MLFLVRGFSERKNIFFFQNPHGLVMHGCFQIAFISGQFTSFPLSRLCKGQVYTVQDLTMGQRQSRRKISIGC